MQIIRQLLTALIAAIVISSCSTTSRLPEGEILYTGIKGVKYDMPKGETLADGVGSQISTAVYVKPNNMLPWSGGHFRTPFPVGLWVWNHWDDPGKGFKHWLYDLLVAEPVLVSDVRPEVRTHMIDQILDNNGYFRGTASYELAQKKNKRKASILYRVNPGPVYSIDSIELLPDTCHLYHMIDSVARRSTYLQPGARYCTDSLSAERVKITNVVRNRGYYFFKPEFIEYLADSLINPGHIVLRMTVASNVAPSALWRYSTGKITTRVYRNRGGGEPDTLHTARGEVIVWRPARLRDKLIPECITFREGKVFSVRDMNRTQTYLAQLGIFNGIDIQAYPDSAVQRDGEHLLDVDIACTFDKPIEVSFELNLSSKSNSYIGPGMNVGLTNRNLFGGGELLNVALNGSYEWQTGRGAKGSVFNSYEFGLTGTLSFPRLLAPRFIPRTRRSVNWTRITLNGDLLNRPHYFKIAQFNASLSYDWRATRHVNTSFTLLKLTYNKLLKTTTVFDSIMDANQAIALSFRDQFVPQMQFSYTYDRKIDRNNSINWQFTVQEAGNVFWAGYELCGVHGEKRLFGTPFSQFVKGQTQVVFGCRVKGPTWMWSRVAVGAAHAYGNASQVPYSEQFYCGGANSVRAFTVRSIGPGSYHSPEHEDGYFDQTGTFKFEANVEYRFPLAGPLHGALFLDAGNVWLLRKDELRPGGELVGRKFFKELATGTGFGLRFDLGMMVLRCDIGIGIHAPYETRRHSYYNMTGSFWRRCALHLAIGYPF